MNELNATDYAWVAASTTVGLDAIGCTSEEDAERIAMDEGDGGEFIPARLVGISYGMPSAEPFRDFLPVSEVVPPFEETADEYFENPHIDYEDHWVYLDTTWRWESIKTEARQGPGHRYKGRKQENLGQLFVKVLYDLEDSLMLVHPNVCRQSAADFFGSLQVWDHLMGQHTLLASSPTTKSLLNHDPSTIPREVWDALKAVNYILWSYVHKQRRKPANSVDSDTDLEKLQPKELWARAISVVDGISPASVYKAGPKGSTRNSFSRWREEMIRNETVATRFFRSELSRLIRQHTKN
jgi:hypothetical protein